MLALHSCSVFFFLAAKSTLVRVAIVRIDRFLSFVRERVPSNELVQLIKRTGFYRWTRGTLAVNPCQNESREKEKKKAWPDRRETATRCWTRPRSIAKHARQIETHAPVSADNTLTPFPALVRIYFSFFSFVLSYTVFIQEVEKEGSTSSIVIAPKKGWERYSFLCKFVSFRKWSQERFLCSFPLDNCLK